MSNTSSIIRTEKYLIRLTKEQIDMFEYHFGADRWVYNDLLHLFDHTDYLKDGDKRKRSMMTLLQYIRHSDNDWIAKGSKINATLVQCSVTNFIQNYEMYEENFKDYKAKNGKKDTFNKDKFRLTPKSKRSEIQSFGLMANNYNTFLITDEGYLDVCISKHFGRHIIKTDKPITIPQEHIKRVIFKKTGDKYEACISFAKRPREAKYRSGSKIGIDLGVKQPIVSWDGENVCKKDIPKSVYDADGNIKFIGRRLERLKRGSKKYNEFINRLNNNYTRRKNCIEDFHCKEVRHYLDNFETIKIDLCPDHWRNGMSDEETKVAKKINHKYMLLRHRGFVSCLKNGADETGNNVIPIKGEATTKTCSVCNHKGRKLYPSERTFVCEQCNHIEDRDVNSAKNVFKWVKKSNK